MTSGPFGGPRPFASDTKTVLVLVGVDGEEPPRDVLVNLEESIRFSINSDISDTLSVNLITSTNPSSEQRDVLGGRTLHVQQYDVGTPWDTITQEQINAIHNEVVGKLNELGFNVEGTQTTVV